MNSKFKKFIRAVKNKHHFENTELTFPNTKTPFHLRLGETNLNFDAKTKKWVAKENPEKQKLKNVDPKAKETIEALQDEIKNLKEENNMLKFRQELMMDLLSVKSLENENFEVLYKKLGIHPQKLIKKSTRRAHSEDGFHSTTGTTITAA